MADPSSSGSDSESRSLPGGRSQPFSDWEELPVDPDLREDLDYDLLDLEAYEIEDGQLLFLPRDEEMIRNEAFIIVDREDVVPLR